MRLQGATYEEVARAGDGILSAVRATREAAGAFLRAVADGKPPPPVPGALPAKLREILDTLAEATRDGDPDH